MSRFAIATLLGASLSFANFNPEVVELKEAPHPLRDSIHFKIPEVVATVTDKNTGITSPVFIFHTDLNVITFSFPLKKSNLASFKIDNSNNEKARHYLFKKGLHPFSNFHKELDTDPWIFPTEIILPFEEPGYDSISTYFSNLQYYYNFLKENGIPPLPHIIWGCRSSEALKELPPQIKQLSLDEDNPEIHNSIFLYENSTTNLCPSGFEAIYGDTTFHKVPSPYSAQAITCTHRFVADFLFRFEKPLHFYDYWAPIYPKTQPDYFDPDYANPPRHKIAVIYNEATKSLYRVKFFIEFVPETQTFSTGFESAAIVDSSGNFQGCPVHFNSWTDPFGNKRCIHQVPIPKD